ncbi:MAG: FAD-binding oxidoreductase [Planctomycetia bacterium]|nr:FAD-binding oxidoreductase [Planctomycetia bacterium]
MNLHTGRPVWAVTDERAKPREYAAAHGELHCEVVVVGGGISGALVGYTLTKRGVDVIVVDRRTPGVGSTFASTGLLQYEVDTPLSDLIGIVGREHAVHAYLRGLTAIDDIETLLDELDDRSEFLRRESLYFASSWWHRARLKREFACRQEAGFDVRLLSRAELADETSLSAAAALHSKGDAQIDPFRFTQSLLRGAERHGMRIFGETNVETFDESEAGIVATTDGATISAKQIVWATGYEVGESLPKMPGRLRSTYAAASAPATNFPGWPDGWLLWETARPYFYARQTSDGRIVIGGEDTSFSQDHVSPTRIARKTERLHKRFAKLFPKIPFEAACTWAGTFAETKDGLAYIGRIPQRPNSFAALGYGGNGITFSMIAAKLIADLITGRPNDDEAVFAFER